MHEESLSPGLIKGRLLSDIGGSAIIYDGLFQGNPVVIKQAKSEQWIPTLQQEFEFINTQNNEIEKPFQEYSVPLDWTVKTRFVHGVPEAVTPEMKDKGIIVLEKVKGLQLINPEKMGANRQVPIKFHLGVVAGWADMARNLASKGIVIDSNIDTDLLIHPDSAGKVLNVVRIDCAPIPGGPKGKSKIQSPDSSFWFRVNDGSQVLTNEQAIVHQMIDAFDILWPSATNLDILGPAIFGLKGRFQEGMINDTESFFGFFHRALAKVKWNDEYIRSGDASRLRIWVNGTF